MSTLLSIWTVLVLIIFLGIVAWAWNGKNKASFDEAARIPLEDELDSVPEEKKEAPKNG